MIITETITCTECGHETGTKSYVRCELCPDELRSISDEDATKTSALRESGDIKPQRVVNGTHFYDLCAACVRYIDARAEETLKEITRKRTFGAKGKGGDG